MDLKTEQILKLFASHLRIKKLLTTLCYGLIFGGIFIYVFYAFDRSKTIKLVKSYKENYQEYSLEKTMTNPRIKFQYKEGQIYQIEAKKAFHKDEHKAVFYDVFAIGDIGSIVAGELKIDEDGEHLTFSKNPILILNKAAND